MTILDIVHDALMAIIAACAPILALYLIKLTGLQATANNVQVVSNSIELAAGVALDHARDIGDPLMLKAETKSASLAKANEYVTTHATQEAAALGVGETALATKVSAKLAHALNVGVPDVTAPVTVGTPGDPVGAVTVNTPSPVNVTTQEVKQ